MSNQLQDVLDNILEDKNENITPNNLKRGIRALGVDGDFNYDEDFEQIDERLDKNENDIGEIKDYLDSELNKKTIEGKEFIIEDGINGESDVVFIGDTEQATRILPEGYTQLDYIESTGTQYIDTGINADSNLRTILDMTYNNPEESNQNIGAINLSSDNIRYHILSQNGLMKIYLQSSAQTITTIEADTDRHYYDIDAPNKIVLVDNNTYNVNISSFDTQLNFWLFGRNSTSTIYYCKNKLYKCKMYVLGTLVRNFIPCKNLSNEVGLYDLVSKTFFGNQGTGDFIAGNEVQIPNPEYPQNIKVVKGLQKVVKRNSKNMINSQFESLSRNGVDISYNASNGEITISGTATALTALNIQTDIEVAEALANQSYTFSLESEGGYIYNTENTESSSIQIWRKWDKNFQLFFNNISNNALSQSKTFTENVVFDTYQLRIQKGDTFNNFKLKIQLEEGSTATGYEKYHRTELPLNLGNMELAKINNNADVIFGNKRTSKYYNAELEEGELYEINNTLKIVLTGTQEESWLLEENGTRFGWYNISLDVPTAISSAYCSHYATYYKYANIPNSYGVSTNNIRLYNDKGFKTVAQFKTWLASNNITILVPKATPTYTKITDETLISQFEAIENEISQKGYNHIYLESENLTPYLQLTYKQSSQLAINSLNEEVTNLKQDVETNYSIITETGNKIDLSINNITYVLKATLKDKNNNIISTSSEIDLPLESMVVGASYDNATKEMVLTLKSGATTRFSIEDLIDGLVNRSELDDYVKNTDYATSTKAGIIKVSGDYGIFMYQGMLACGVKTAEQYNRASTSNGLFISKGTLENVLAERIGDLETALTNLNLEAEAI